MTPKHQQIAATNAGSVAAETFLRITQILGRPAVSEKQAAENRRTGKGPRRSKAAIPPILPIGKSSWWQGVREGRFPKPVKLGPGSTAWRISDINALLQQLGRAP